MLMLMIRIGLILLGIMTLSSMIRGRDPSNNKLIYVLCFLTVLQIAALAMDSLMTLINTNKVMF